MSSETVEDEIRALRARVASLERECRVLREHGGRLEELSSRLYLFYECANETIAILDRGVVVEVNPRVRTMFGYDVEDAVGRSALEFVAPASREMVAHNIRTGYPASYEALGLRKDGTTFPAQFHGQTVTYEGRDSRVTMVLDLTEAKRAEAATREAAVQAEVLDAHARMIAELSTPLLPIAEDVIVVPLVGAMNDARGDELVEALLGGIAAKGARIAIVDVTGVRHVDAPALGAIARAARAAALLGAEVVLTGVGPEMARSFVEQGTDLAQITTLGTLAQAVSQALRRAPRTARRP
jgi:PAS domain S-box-containing protein